MKRLVTILLAFTILFSNFSFIYAERNQGVVEKAAEFLQKEKILIGNDTGDLFLEKALKRQDAVILLSRLLGSEEEAKYFPTDNLKFTDIKNNYYKPFIAWALANGYFKGYSEQKFGFGDEITVQQYSIVLLRILGYDIDYKVAIEKGREIGLLKGIEEKEDIASLSVPRNIVAIMTVNTLTSPINPQIVGGSSVILGTKLKINVPKELIKAISEEKLSVNPSSVPPTTPVVPPITTPVTPPVTPPIIPPTPEDPTPLPKPDIPKLSAEFITKVDIQGLVPFGIANIIIKNLPESDTYELDYKLSDDKLYTTERTKLNANEPPIFRYTEYVNIRIYDIDGNLLRTFKEVRLITY